MDINKINPIVLEILRNRGIIDSEEIQEFLSEKPQLTYDPFLLKNMKEGVDFVISSLQNNEHICIYGDYDVDGITSTALLYNFLKIFTRNITYYIPSRFEEGYGLNKESLSQLKKQGVHSVITVDCGAVSKNEVEHAKDLGLKIMVTDHHNMEQDTAPDCIVINPKHYDTKYPFQGLCGCAVAFKLVQALVRTKRLNRNYLTEYLDLVAIATVSDVVPLIDENRTLVKYGLKKLNKNSSKAIGILLNRLEIEKGTVDSYKIGFIIGPHMNAAGRISHANAVVKMLTSNEDNEINSIIDDLILNNKKRRAIQEKCLEESVAIVVNRYLDAPILMIEPPDVHEGIAGIVAGKLKEMYNKPVIVLSRIQDDKGETMLKGSGRSIKDIDMIKMLQSYKDIFVKLGGHSMAAGFSLPLKNEPKLRESLYSYMYSKLGHKPELFTKIIREDVTISKEKVNRQLISDIKLLEPYGVGNPRPLLKIKKTAIKNINYMGDNKKHVRFTLDDLNCVLFGITEESAIIIEKENTLNIYGYPDINVWNGYEKLQFVVKAIKDGEE